MKRAAITAGGNLSVGIACLSHSEVVGDRHGAKKFRVVLLQSCQIHLSQFDGCHLFRANQLGELRHLPERNIFEIPWPLDFGRRAYPDGALGAVDSGSGKNRIEVERWRDRIF